MTEAVTALDDIIEAALLAAGEPLPLERLETLFLEGECPTRKEFRNTLERLQQRHAGGALELLESVSGYQLRIRPRLSQWVSRLWDERPQRYSRALLETLALIAYRQPVTRSDIEEVRGVSVSSSIMRTLAERGWIRVVGHRDVPGRPAVYATTRSFLDDFGLKTLDALPPMHTLASWDENALDENALDENALTEEPGVTQDADTQEQNGPDLAHQALDETRESVQDSAPQNDELSTAESAENHAETALTQPLSFADLQARLAARAKRQQDEREGTQTTDVRSDDHESE